MSSTESAPTLPTDSATLGAIWGLVCQAVTPPPDLSVAEWALKNRRLGTGAAESGPFDCSVTPYLAPFYREAVDCRYKRVVGVVASQMGKTDCYCNIIGHQVDLRPAPVLYIAPTKDFITDVWEPRYTAMVDSSPSLKAKAKQVKREKKVSKEIAGVTVRFGWAGSPTQLRGMTAKRALVDERDAMTSDVKGEGDPVELADSRHATYLDGQTWIFSTPTVGTVDVEPDEASGREVWAISDEVGSPIWQLWQEGTRHEWCWQCPECSDYFAPRFRYLVWPEGRKSATIQEGDVTLACPSCGVLIDEDYKGDLNAAGLELAPGQSAKAGKVEGEAPASTTFSLWVSGLCSPWRSWTELARRYLAAVESGDPERIQAVVNTGAGELYSVSGEAPPWEAVAELRMDYVTGEVPEGVSDVFLTVDVQKDRLVFVVRGWQRGRGMRSWLLEHGELYGPTDEAEVWDALGQFRERFYASLPIGRAFVDQKYRADHVFKFCRRFKGWAFPVAGFLPKSDMPENEKPLRTSRVDVTSAGKVQRGGLLRWNVNTDYFKTWVHERVERGTEAGWYISADTSDDYCKQIVAEARVIKASGRVMWQLIKKDNHYLDCEMMQVACAYSRQLHQYQGTPVATPKGKQRATTKRAPLRARGSGRSSNFFGSR